jgi:hypothetical protein
MRVSFRTEGFFKQYPYYTGDIVWPIARPAIPHFDPDLWTGEYGFRRVALLEYIIMKLESL